MGRTKKPLENQPPIVSPREKELLDKLDLIKQAKQKITVIGFCKYVGYANKSALRHFPVLRRELSLYVAQFSRPGQKREAPLATKYFEAQIARQGLAINRLKRQAKTIPTLKAKIALLETKAKQDSEEKKQLRGMLSTVIAFLSGSDFAKARDLSERLEKLVTALLEEDPSGYGAPNKHDE
jgi:hypothetical protein